MIWIALSVLMFVCAVGAGIAMYNTDNGVNQKWGIGGFLVGYGSVTAVWALLSLLFMVHIVDERNVGVVRTLGQITGQIDAGLNVTAPWQTVEEYNIKLQVIEPDTECANGTKNCMSAGSIDVQDVYVQAALNMEVSVENVQELARNIGQNYKDTVVLNRLEQVTKAVISTYKADTILAKREEIRAEITRRMQQELAPYSINVADVLLTNIDFTDTFRAAIEAKVKAEVDAATERNRIEISKAQAEQNVETARGQAEQARVQAQGESDRLRITAEGQAEANRILTASLTPTLIQWETVQRLVDNIEIMLLPTDSNTLLQLPQLSNP